MRRHAQGCGRRRRRLPEACRGSAVRSSRMILVRPLWLSVAPAFRLRAAGHEAAQHFEWRDAFVHDGDHVFDDRYVDTVGVGELEDRLTRFHALGHLPRARNDFGDALTPAELLAKG